MYKEIYLGLKYQEYYTLLRDEYKIYPTHFDTFLDAAVIGCMENEYIFETVDSKQERITRVRIPQSVLINNKTRFELITNLVTFIHYSRMEDQKILSKIFLDTDEAVIQKQEIIEGYAKGGIKKLYDNLVGASTSKDDILENLVNFTDNFDDVIKFKDFGDMDSIISRLV
jgi:hypothetical protein